MDYYGIVFDGKTTYATLPASLIGGRKAFAVDMWIATTFEDYNYKPVYRHGIIGVSISGYHANDWYIGINRKTIILYDGMGGTYDSRVKAAYKAVDSNVTYDASLFGDAAYDTTVAIADGEKHHIVLTSDGSAMTTTIDEVECAQKLYIANACTSDAGITLGQLAPDDGDNDTFTPFTLYELKVYDSNDTTDSANLKLHYRPTLEDYKSAKLIDRTGNGNDATLNGTIDKELDVGRNFYFRTLRKTSKDVEATFATKRHVVRPVELSYPLKRKVYKSVALMYPVKRHTWNDVEATFQTVRKIPFDFGDIGAHIGKESTYHLKSITITLAENTLSDKVQAEAVADMKPNDAMRGNLLDYSFDMQVESASYKGYDASVGGDKFLQRVTSMYRMDELLNYPRFLHFVTSGTTWQYIEGVPTAVSVKVDLKDEMGNTYSSRGLRFSGQATAMSIAKALGLIPSIYFSNFIPDNAYTHGQQITYKGLLSQVFGWATSLPWRQINVFIRGNVLFFVQRGKEPCEVNIDGLNTSIPQITRSIYRTEWDITKTATTTRVLNPKDFEDAGSDEPGSDDDKNGEEYQSSVPVPVYFDGILTCGNTTLVYTNGLCTAKTVLDPSDMKTITYRGTMSYDSQRRVTNKQEYSNDEMVITTISYGEGTDNNSNTTTETKYECELDGSTNTYKMGDVITQIVTVSIDLGNGFVGTSTYVDGEYQGSSISGSGIVSKGDYTTNEANKRASKGSKGYTMPDGTTKKPGVSSKKNDIPDSLTTSNLPKALLKLYAEEIKSYNRSIQETVSLNVISKVVNGVISDTHIIDFTDKILFHGNTYYLQSNTVALNTSSFTQALTFTRWIKRGDTA